MPALTFDSKNLPKSEDDIDFSDLEAKYSLELDESFDNVVVVDGLPKVDESKFEKLLTVVNKIFKKYGTIKPEGLSMPQTMGEDGKLMTAGYLFMEFETPEQAALAIKSVNGYAFDKKHTLSVNKFSDIELYTNMKEEYVEPKFDPYVEKEHLLGHLSDQLARDQLVTLIGDYTSIVWNNRGEAPELISSKRLWTESYASWSPRGTYLTTFHRQGIALWGGSSWHKMVRFVHPGVKLVDFSPNERYLVSWSNDPITAGVAPFTEEHEGHSICVWDVKTGMLLRTFPNLSSKDEEAPLKMTWPAFKWSPNEKYFARCVPGQMLSIYEAPGMGLLDKKSIKVEGIADFEWAPTSENSGEKNDSKALKPDLLVYWTPERTNTPARVTLISIPSREILRTKNLFNVVDCKFYWHSAGNLLAVRVNRFTKSKKSTYSNLEIFRVREKDIPVEVVELKDTVISFAWEPTVNGTERFSIIATGDSPPAAPTAMGVAPPTVRTNISIYARDLVVASKKTLGRDNFKRVAHLEKQTFNTFVWSPKGRHFVMATLRSQSTYDIAFCDLDFNKDFNGKKDDAGLQTLVTNEHYGITDVEWDPTGRYVVTSSSVWRQTSENGFYIWDFKGTLQYKKIVDNFKQVLWRPRPKSLLSQEQRRQIRKNLDNYSVQFDEEDVLSRNAVSAAVLTQRRRLVDEWKAWRLRVERHLAEESINHAAHSNSTITDDSNEEIEEWVEEVVEEFEEIVD